MSTAEPLAMPAVPPADPASARRKACDLCFTKKIKCDMLKPVCSNCKLYSSECRTTSVARRKANVSRAKAASKAQSEHNELTSENESLKARLARIESQLAQVLDSTKRQHEEAITPAPTAESRCKSWTCTSHKAGTGSVSSSSGDEWSPGLGTPVKPWKFDPVEPSLYTGPTDEGLPLPPIDNIIPIVDHYFKTFNQVLPLFDQENFMHLLTGFYAHTIPRDNVVWAAILMVCAMGLRSPVPGDIAALGTNGIAPEGSLRSETQSKMEWANHCMRNAQGVMSELCTREEDLLGLQTLLALVLQFHNSSDSRPASVLMGPAVRLAHRLGLHAASASKNFSESQIRQRNKVFWIAYTLDKDISLRAKAPSSQNDADIDIPLPPLNPSDGSGLIWTNDSQSVFNAFRMRLDLSHIQGKIYDLLYSNRSHRAPAEERKRRVSQLSAMLSQWYERIPSAFRIEHASSTVGEMELVQMVKMHHAYLHAMVHVHGVYSNDAEWMGRVGTLSKAAISEFAVRMQGKITTCGSREQQPPQQDGWDECVEIARGCMKLFQDATPTECLIWQCSCAHFSGLIILLANMIITPSHSFVSLDQQIADRAVRLFEELVQVITASAFHTLHRLITDLHQGANAAVAEARRLEASSQGEDQDVENTFFSSTIGQGAFDGQEQDIGFPSFIGEEMAAGMEFDGAMWDSFALGMEGSDGFESRAFHTA